jgi:threonine/homoserine/homoserine lactone efflux protein
VTLESWLAFAAASAFLILMPGPMVALIIANAVSGDRSAGLATVGGAMGGLAVHLLLVCLGLAVLLAGLGEAIFWLKFAGAAYLFYLGVKTLLSKKVIGAPGRAKAARPPGRVFAEAFLVQITNPKLLIFYAAFFPLFLDPSKAALPQLLVMSATFLIIEGALESMWALGAARARPMMLKAGRWTNRVTGGVLIAAAAGMAAMKR